MAEPLNATFFAFRKRERGGVLFQATMAYYLIMIALIAAFVAVNYPTFAEVGRWFASLSANGAAAQAAPQINPMGIMALFLLGFIWMFFFYILLAAYEAACLKWMIHGETSGFMGLNLGADTWRVYSGYWIWFLINMVLSFTVSIVMMPLMFMGMAGAAAGGVGDDPFAMSSGMILFQVLYYVVYYGIFAFVGVRFAPAAATSIARRKFSFFDAWKVTRGRFWTLLGSFVVIILIYAVAFLLIGGVGFGFVIGSSWSDLANLGPMTSNEDSLAAMGRIFSPQNWAIIGAAYLAILVVAMLFAIMFYGVNARAVIAAMEEGKIPGITLATANTFE